MGTDISAIGLDDSAIVYIVRLKNLVRLYIFEIYTV